MKRLRLIHLCSGLVCLPFVLLYLLSGVAIAHRSWFRAPALVRLHTQAPPVAGEVAIAVVSIAMLLLGASGFLLWWKTHRQRKWGVIALLLGGGVAMGLIVSMRLS